MSSETVIDRLSVNELVQTLKDSDAWCLSVDSKSNNLVLHTLKDNRSYDWAGPDWRQLSDEELFDYSIKIQSLITNPVLLSKHMYNMWLWPKKVFKRL